ncbi:Endonuclease/exonuclease/phosphatase [Aspergillus ambiguus]|uniref:endonuclease/exonuclease/phosphatase family protein n=1 Tax=Aspergillus ambiguus TaxID=176160 RepID=UPI003CCCE254
MSFPKNLDLPNPHNDNNPVNQIRLTTWNIDFQVPCKKERTAAALRYLSQRPSPVPQVIFLQEMVASDLELIKSTPWIQTNFYITDYSPQHWLARYGTTTLVDKRLPIERVFRVPYAASRMQRDALFVDIARGPNTGPLRLCNTHLESLVSVPPRRPVQLRRAAHFMHGTPVSQDESRPLPVLHAAVLAGDLNAFAPEDRVAPQECGLQDAFLVLGGEDSTEESFTWGQQVSAWKRERFGCSRMDKVLFCGNLRVTELQRIGAGEKVWIKYPTEQSDQSDDEKGEEMWVTDHLGLQADFDII